MLGAGRTVAFRINGEGEVIRRDESDSYTSSGDPHEVWYRFDGHELGYVGNNGTSNLTEAGSIADRKVVSGTGAFRNGSTTSTAAIDFAQSYDALNSYNQGSAAGS